MTKRRSLIFAEPGRIEVREESVSAPSPHQLLVETVVSAVSAGTEMLVYRGQVPTDMAVDETIEALGEAAFGYPLKYGYAVVGRVIEVGGALDSQWLGRVVFAFNPHESHFVADVGAVLPLPDDMLAETAVFLPNMETAISFVMDGRPMIGEQVAVVGQGVVGLLTTAVLAGMPLAALVTLDALSLRREWSATLGADAGLDATDPEASALARAVLQGDRPYPGADLVYELSGNPAALDAAIGLAGYNGRIVVGSWYGQKPVSVDLGSRFHRSHMQIISSQVSHIAPQWLGRWTKERRLGVAWEMLRRIGPDRLITHRFPIEQAAEAYQTLDKNSAETIQVVLTYK